MRFSWNPHDTAYSSFCCKAYSRTFACSETHCNIAAYAKAMLFACDMPSIRIRMSLAYGSVSRVLLEAFAIIRFAAYAKAMLFACDMPTAPSSL